MRGCNGARSRCYKNYVIAKRRESAIMTHGPMITFRFNGLSSVRGWLDIYRSGVRRRGEELGVRTGEWMRTESTAQGVERKSDVEGGGRGFRKRASANAA